MYELTTMLPNGKRPTVIAHTRAEVASLVVGLTCEWHVAYYRNKEACRYGNHCYRLFSWGMLLRWNGSSFSTKYNTRIAKQFKTLIDSMSE